MIRLVVDSNSLFTFFWKNSVFNELCNQNLLELYSPEYSLEEIKKYSSEIIIKKLPEAERLDLMKDIDFLALSLKLNIPLWSNDKLLKRQQAVEILTTEEIIKIIF